MEEEIPLEERFADNRSHPDDTMLVECTCGDHDHIMIWQMDRRDMDSKWLDDYPPEMYISYHLTLMTFLRRLWAGIKYIFGHRSRYGEFGCVSLDIKDVKRLEDFLAQYKKVCYGWADKKGIEHGRIEEKIEE